MLEGESMRRFSVIMAVMVATLLQATAVSAAPGSAGDIAADCNDDGVVTVYGTERYIGGVGTITRDCNVNLTAGAKLVLRNVTLTSTGSLAAISSPPGTTIKVLDSTITAAGSLELTAGCCAGEPFEVDGTVIVRRSDLSGSSLQILASFGATNGRAVVAESTLTASGAFGVQVRTGPDGLTRVRDSVISSGGDVWLASAGDTRARRNTLSAAGTVTIEGGVSCASIANTPAVPCT